jgi:hypothetical protein
MQDKLYALSACRVQNNQNLANLETKLLDFRRRFSLTQHQINNRDLLAEIKCYQNCLHEYQVFKTSNLS